MRKLFGLIAFFVLFAQAAHADWTGKDASGTTVTFSNPNTCTSVVCVPTAQLVNASGGTLLGTAGTANAGVLTVQGIASMTPLLATLSGTNNLNNISGTISLPTGASTAAKQPALGTAGSASADVLSVQGIASMTPLLATLSGTNNLNNISGTISLPTGASTAAKQPALGTAGSASTDVITIQGIASMTALQVSQATAANLNVTALGGQATVSAGNSQNAVTANANGTSITVTGYGAALFNVNCSVNCSGGTTINFEALDVVGTAFAVGAIPVTGATTAVSSVTNQSGAAQFCVPNMGYTSMRGRVSGYSAGTISVTITPINSAGCDYAQVANANVNGSATSANSSPVVIASDQAAVAVKAASSAYASGSLASGAVVDLTNMSASTGAAAPSKAIYPGTLQSGATGGFIKGNITCDNHVFKHITTATDTLAVQGVTSQTIYVCAWRSRAAGVATWFLENTASTNANCSSTLTQVNGVATEAANTGETWGSAFWSGLKNTSGNGLCINSTGTGGVDVDIWYTQF